MQSAVAATLFLHHAEKDIWFWSQAFLRDIQLTVIRVIDKQRRDWDTSGFCQRMHGVIDLVGYYMASQEELQQDHMSHLLYISKRPRFAAMRQL